MAENTELAQRERYAAMQMDGGALRPQNLDQAMTLANMLSKSSFVPQAYREKPGDVLAAVQMGAEVGLSPMQALQNIAVINGRPSIWGDALLGLALADPRCQDVIETFDEESQTATCTVKVRGRVDVVRTFSLEDAKRAGLAGKKGPWQEYRTRMLQMRARGFAVRDAFPDVLRGLALREEASDLPPVEAHGEPYVPEQLPPKSASARLKRRRRSAEELEEAAQESEAEYLEAKKKEREASKEKPEPAPEDGEPIADPDTVAAEAIAFIKACNTVEALDGADWSMVEELPDDLKRQVREAFQTRKAEVSGG